MFNSGDKIVLNNPESKYNGLTGKVISYYPKYKKLHVQLNRPFINDLGEEFNEIIYLSVNEDVVVKSSAKSEKDKDAIITQIKILLQNFSNLCEKDKKLLGEKYIKMIGELINN